MVAIDPYAPPSKVRDEVAERMLGEVLAAVRDLNGRQAELEAALQQMVHDFAEAMPRPQPVDVTPIVEAIERTARQPQPQPLAPSLDPAMVSELRSVIADVAVKPGQWDEIIERLTEATNKQPTVMVNGGKEVRLKDASQNIIDPATETTLQQVAVGVGTTLAARMLAKNPAADYTLWLDTSDASHIYTLEAPAGTASTATGFRGIRITLDAAGNPVGAVETNTSATLTFANRTTDPGWGA